MDLQNIEVDKNYNIFFKDNKESLYLDKLDELLDKLIDAKEKNKINEREFQILANYFINRSFAKEVGSIAKSLKPKSNKRKSLYLSYLELKRRYAGT